MPPAKSIKITLAMSNSRPEKCLFHVTALQELTKTNDNSEVAIPMMEQKSMFEQTSCTLAQGVPLLHVPIFFSRAHPQKKNMVHLRLQELKSEVLQEDIHFSLNKQIHI